MDLQLRRNQAFFYEDGAEALIDRSITKANVKGTTIGINAFNGCTQLKSVNAPNATKIGASTSGYQDCFYGCTNLISINAPSLSMVGQRAFYNCSSLKDFNSPIIQADDGVFTVTANSVLAYTFSGCTSMKSVFCTASTLSNYAFHNTGIVTAVFTNNTGNLAYLVPNCTSLETIDLQYNSGDIRTYCFRYDSKLTNVILRKTSGVVSLWTVAAFDGTPFASGGTGGTVYIPKVLYDHLEDGTSLDYLSDANWATVNGYGTITWAPIEGSQYENYYADGTPIST